MYKSDINFNLYKTFYDVATYGSISKAAVVNYTSQQAISRSIKKLEEQLNNKLFHRTKKGIELTEKGKELYFYVEQGYNSFLTAERSMLETNTLDKGKLSIGIPSHIATFYLFDAIDAFHKDYPNIEITIINKSTTKLMELLKSHEIDFVIDSEPIKAVEKDMTIKHIKRIENVFVANENYDITDINTVKDLENHPLILPIKGTANRNNLEEYFIKNDCSINNILNIHTSEVIIGAIKRNLGIGYVIKDLVTDELEKGTLKEIKLPNLPTVGISLVYVKDYMTISPKLFLNKYYNIDI